jgi:comEA protein
MTVQAGKISRTEQMVFLVIACLILAGSGFRLWCHQDELMLEVEPVLWAAEDNDRDEGHVSKRVGQASLPDSFIQPDPLGSIEEVREGEQVTKDGSSSSQSAKEVGAPEPRDKVQPNTQSHKVNINTASSEELMTLPGIGPVLASRILEYRQNQGPFIDVEQLMEVKGIGAKTLARLRPLVTVKDVATPKDQ